MNTVDQNPQALVTANEQSQRSSPTRRWAADQSDPELMDRSQALIGLMKQVDCVSDSDMPVLLTGEHGSGKQLIACAIHQRSPRSNQPFIVGNCAVLPAGVIDAELFGFDEERRSLWEKAEGGTLFLDEITEADLSSQEKLLRVLQTSELSRPGSDETQHVNVRVIAASSRSLEDEVAAGRFREDLFYALRALSIVLPPLPTVQFTARDEQNGGRSESPDEPVNGDWVPLSEIEGRYVARVLVYTRGNKQAAARILSVDRKTLDRMIKRHHIVYPHARHRAKASASS